MNPVRNFVRGPMKSANDNYACQEQATRLPKQSDGQVSNGVKLRGLTLIAVVFLTFLYIYQEVTAVRISYEIKTNKKILAELKEENAVLRYKLALLVSPANLEKEIEDRDIGLCLGDEMKVVELVASVPSPQPARLTKSTRLVSSRKSFIQGFLKSLLSKEAEAEE